MKDLIFKSALKRAATVGLCIASAVSMITSAIPTAEAVSKASKDTLSTNTALGSPVLNHTNFTTEDWNEWETICWGVFLSNFCNPFIDNYQSAFQAGYGGSNGHGFDALWGGSWSDLANADVVRALTEYAIDVQAIVNEEVYVGYTKIKDGQPEEHKSDSDITEGDLRPATIRDLFFYPSASYDGEESSEDITYAILTDDNGMVDKINVSQLGVQYDGIASVVEGNLPTFYVHRPVGENKADEGTTHDEWITILDYNDWWDVQIMSWLTNAVSKNGDLGSSVIDGEALSTAENAAENAAEQVVGSTGNGSIDALKKLWESNAAITFDTFGNIVTAYEGAEGCMVLPACVNRNITGSKRLNILNSWIFNNVTSNCSDDIFLLGMHQNFSFKDINEEGKNKESSNGLPALGESSIGNVGMFYFDLDSVFVKEYLKAKGSITSSTAMNDFDSWEDDIEDAFSDSYDMRYGNALLYLFGTKISKYTSPRLPLKFEIAQNNIYQVTLGEHTSENENGQVDINSVLARHYACANNLPNILFDYDANEKDQRGMLTSILTPKGEVKALFGSDPVAIPVRVKSSTDEIAKTGKDGMNNDKGAAAMRYFFNWLYNKYNIADSAGGSAGVYRHTVELALQDKTFQEMTQWFGNPDDKTTLYSSFLNDYQDKAFAKATGNSFTGYQYHNAGTGAKASEYGLASDYDENESFGVNTNRVILAYKPNALMEEISNVLAIKEGSEFDLYCSYIYMTYLDFYGVNSSATIKTGVANSSDFDSILYNTDFRKSVLITDVAKTLYEKNTNFADKISIEDEVLQMSYMMLEPDNQSAREYRRQLTNNAMTDFMYEQYNRIVFGGSSNYSGTTSRSKSGFLSIETFADNYLTGWFLDAYVMVAVFLIMGSILAIIIVGLIKQRKFSWFIISILLAVNSIMLLPTSGEIVPYVTSSVTTRMFANKMTFWSISQGITNHSVERDVQNRKSEFSDLADNDEAVILSLINDLSTLQTDSSLCVKQDISQKVTQSVDGIYKDVESYPSAQWIIPMVVQQFSSDNEQTLENFIYKPVNNIWCDLSNIYWYFNPDDADAINASCKTYTSGQITYSAKQRKEVSRANGEETDNLSKNTSSQPFECLNVVKTNIHEQDPAISSIYPDFVSPDDMVRQHQDGAGQYWFYNCYSHSLHDPNTEVHVVLPYLTYGSRSIISRKAVFGADMSNYTDADSWGSYIAQSNSQLKPDAWYVSWDPVENGPNDPSVAARMEDTADSYDRYDRNTITADMPYLLTTESPIYYFYSVVKDSFNSSDSLQKVVSQIQGKVTPSANGKNVLSSFMYATKSNYPNAESDVINNTVHYDGDVVEDTGYVRDVLDLQEMFTNVVPYMYQMSITACGFNGTDGLLGDSKISNNLMYYEGEYQSWMYRCNWATKIMENPSYSEPATIYDASGTKYTVKNPMLAESYPEGRPMIFSEAQREAYGLHDADLNIVELKCIELNKKVADSWTLLLNYATTKGINKEIFYRQMATDATLLFCDEFGSSGILDTKYTMYPTSLDLRFLSYDAIMKILMLNVSKNTNFIYGDSMITVLSESDFITGACLLLSALLGAYIMPFLRALLMAIIFYLGIWATLRTILGDKDKKLNITCGQLVTNVLFMVYTIIYYAAFWMLMGRNSTTEVLTTRTVKSVEAGSPFWVILLTCIINIVYIFVLCAHIKFCFEHRADMGYSAYSQMANSIVGSISDLGGRVGNSISNFFGADSGYSNPTGNTRSMKGSGFGAGVPGQVGLGVNSDNTSGQPVTVTNESTHNNKGLGLNDADYAKDTTYDNDTPVASDTTASDINDMIDEGASAVAPGGASTPSDMLM